MLNRPPRASRGRDRRGQALVELAGLLPLLLVCLMGAAQLGAILYTGVSVDGAARDGALAASQSPIHSQAYSYNSLSTTTSSGPGITCSSASPNSGNPVCDAWSTSASSLSSLSLTLDCGDYASGSCSGSASGDCPPQSGTVTVTASATVPIFIPIIGNLFADSSGSGVRTVTDTVTMRVQPCGITDGS